ncbi:MAG: lycopene cyclase domain-containing protein [bacterium]|nr:lycopene cyclase domain-containing protein [bacterium]
MKGLYLILDVVTLLCPLILSFDNRVRYVKSWGNVLLASTAIAIPFLVWDVLFTEKGVWGFNPEYLVNISIFGLPIEEILFFWVVPFACVFIYECCKFYFRNMSWRWLTLGVQVGILAYLVFLSTKNPSGWYTLTTTIATVITLYFWFSGRSLPQISIAYLLCLIPFLVVNGVLTGSWIEAPIVWYNSKEFSDVRMGTIPMEDAMYGFSLIVANILLHEQILRWRGMKSFSSEKAAALKP